MRKKYTRAFSIAWLLVWYLAACIFVAKYSVKFLDADMSGELVLARLLADEGSILSKNWFYSSELRVLNTQLVFMPLFLIFDNWHTVRVLGTAILLAIMTASCLYCARGLKLSWNTALLCAGVLLMPLSQSYAYAVLEGAYYVPHISISLLLFGLYARYAEEGSAKARRIKLAAALLLAFLSGLGGIRQLFVFTAPAAFASVLAYIPSLRQKAEDKTDKFCLISVSAFLASGVGFLVNKLVLLKIYSFSDYAVDFLGNAVNFGWFDINGVGMFINKLLELFGWRPGAAFSGTLLYNGIAGILLLICAFSVWFLLKEKNIAFVQRAMALFIVAGSAVFLAICTCTDMEAVTRYFVPLVICFIFTVGAMLEQWKIDNKLKKLAAAALLSVLAVININTYMTNSRTDKNAANRDVVRVIDECGVYEGYSSFWAGNLLTELSNGEIEMRVLGSGQINGKINCKEDLSSYYKWLQKKSHPDTVPGGRFFLLLNSLEYELCALPLTPDYINETYALYFFDDFEDFAALYGG